MRGTFSLKTENVYETAKTRSFFVSLIISPSGMVMIPIPCSFCAFLLKRYMAAANIRFRIGFLSCDQYMTRMKRKSTSGIVRKRSFFCKYSILSDGYFPLSVILFVCQKEAMICRKKIISRLISGATSGSPATGTNGMATPRAGTAI